MKIYVIYRKRTELEIDHLISGQYYNRSRAELAKEVYAFTASKKFAKEFMRIHSDKYFEMKRKKYNDEEYCDFLEDYREKELNAVELSDRRNKIYVPMTEDEETEMDTTYYPPCLGWLKQYHRVGYSRENIKRYWICLVYLKRCIKPESIRRRMMKCRHTTWKLTGMIRANVDIHHPAYHQIQSTFMLAHSANA